MITPLHKRSYVPEPMDDATTQVFMFVCMNPIPADVKNDFMYKLCESRLEYHNIEADENVIAIVSYLAQSPGQAVLYCHSLAHIFDEYNRKVTMQEFSMCYPNGFPSFDELQKAWDEQKVEGVNGVDMPEHWPEVV